METAMNYRYWERRDQEKEYPQMNTMRFVSHLARHARRAATSVLCALAVLGFLVTTTPAQIRGHQTFDVPFGFLIGKSYCPAGTYTVRMVSPGVLAIANANRSRSVMVLARIESGKKADNHASLVFNRFGDARYLGQVRLANEPSILQLRRSDDELDVAKSWSERQETVVAAGPAKP
jgi:hypothetical protein